MKNRFTVSPLFAILLIVSLLSTQGFLPTSYPTTNINLSTPVNIIIDAGSQAHSISPYIYGLNFAKESFANEIDLPLRRWGGNATSRYNWQSGKTNTANDWYYENTTVTNAYDWNTIENHNDWIEQNIRTDTDSLITIPMLGYVSKDGTSCGFNIALYPNQQEVDPYRPSCGNGVWQNGSYVTGNNPLDTSIAVNPSFMQDWASTMVSDYGSSTSGGVKFYALDNEPELWSDTHRDIHPAHQTYDELLEKSINYGEAVKAADPNANLLGYVAFGWSGYWYSYNDLIIAAQNGYTYFPDYATHGNKYQVEWYLAQMNQYEQTNDVRLLDYLDLHYYPESGVALQLAGGAETQALRLRSTRSLWDPTYRDESWIGGNDQTPEMRYVKLIPRMHGWINNNYPGTKLAITEYNFGGLEHINGALAQAEVLGIFGREGVDMAALWNYPLPGNDPLGYDNFENLPGAYAFRMFRNYDGNGSKFGGTSISAISDDRSKLSVFAAERSEDGSITVIAINKTSTAITSNVSLMNFVPDGLAKVYRYSSANLNAIVQQPSLPLEPNGFTYGFPANSITMIVIPPYTGENPYGKTVISAATQDGWILESTETSNVGGTMNSTASTLNLGDDSANRQYRAILSFNTAALPDDAVITSATLKFKYAGKTGTLPFSTHGSLLADIRKGPYSNNPALQLNDFKAAASKNNLLSFTNDKVNNWYSKSFTTANFQYINLSGITQFRLRFQIDDNHDFGADFLRIYSGNAAAADRPQLIIKYTLP
ncbi:MAG: glycoside hydrolase family 44 protein [Chloroflexi bacterium]|nr:glycoside hydrolase family 44 protein [Chloroflexota bacterium]